MIRMQSHDLMKYCVIISYRGHRTILVKLTSLSFVTLGGGGGGGGGWSGAI